MYDSAIFSLIAFGGAAIFGLQGALSLAVQHSQVRDHHPFSACNKVALSKEAQIAKIPVAYGAVIFYGFVLAQLLRNIYLEEIQLYWLNSAMVAAMLVTCYYAYVMLFKLRLVCMGCLRIYLANLLMAAALSAYHLY
jgi:uncharacterized membrane protein